MITDPFEFTQVMAMEEDKSLVLYSVTAHICCIFIQPRQDPAIFRGKRTWCSGWCNMSEKFSFLVYYFTCLAYLCRQNMIWRYT